MFFDDLAQLPEIAARTSCTIFVVPPDTIEVNAKSSAYKPLKNTIFLTPDESKTTRLISVDQIRDFISLASNLEVQDRYFVIAPADAMNEAAQNAFLKTFEEPHDFCHFILLTESPGALLPTIRSRAQIFYPRLHNQLDTPPHIDAKTTATQKKILDQAKQLISSPASSLPQLATELAKVKNKPREHALSVVAAAIELLYKSYFKTNNPKLLTKLPQLLTLYDALQKNGHIKLHLVADLC